MRKYPSCRTAISRVTYKGREDKLIRSSRPRTKIIILTLGFAAASAQAPLTQSTLTIDRQTLCITEGAIDTTSNQRLTVNTPKMRAYVNRSTAQTIAATFTYLGPSQNQEALGSGAIRRQFGLKLHAQNACNLIYAMWRFEPKSQIVVSVKANPNQHSSAECGNSGYQNIKPLQFAPVPAPQPGSQHQLQAQMNGSHLQVFVDNAIVWNGAVAKTALLEGPVGIRSDNVKLEMELHVAAPQQGQPQHVSGCPSAPEPE